MTRIARTAIAAGVVLLGVVAAGCGNDDYPGGGDHESDMTPQEQFDDLMRRPAIDETRQRYQAMSEKIRARLSDQFDLPEWTSGGGGRVSPGCGDFPDVDGWDAQRHFGDDWATSTPLTDAQWEDAVTELKDIAGTYGFDTVTFDITKADHREIKLTDSYGATLYLGRGEKTLVGVDTGCHLNGEAKTRGTPRPTTTR